jgi:hypothetical protein
MKSVRKMLLAGLATVVAAAAAYAADANVTGTWTMSVDTGRGARDSTMVLTQAGDKITGTYKGQRGEMPVTGTVKGNAVTLTYKLALQGNEMEVKYNGTVEGAAMNGTVSMGQMGEGKFTGKKQ